MVKIVCPKCNSKKLYNMQSGKNVENSPGYLDTNSKRGKAGNLQNRGSFPSSVGMVDRG